MAIAPHQRALVLTAVVASALWMVLAVDRPAGSPAPEDIPARSDQAAGGPLQPFAIELPPVRLTSGGWRLSWESVPGRRYRLQHWTSDELGVVGTPAWTDVALVQATGLRTSADDPSAVSGDRRFYRVMLVEETGGDTVSPAISAIRPQYVPANNLPAARLSVTATDNTAVTRVAFFNGSALLGDGVRGAGDTWELTLPLDTRQLGARFLIARAFDAAGNFANSPVFPLGLVDPDHFLPLNASGLPIEGGIVPAVAPGQWGPVEYRPGGRSLNGLGAGFFLRFPQGVLLKTVDGQQVLEFTNVLAGFSAGYPLQLTVPLSRQGGGLKQLRVGPVDLRQVLAVFDRDPTAGIGVTLFNRFALNWGDGILDDGGIVAPRFGFVGNGTPMPGLSGDFPEFRLDLSRNRGLRIPFTGEFTLPDGSETPTRIFVGAGSPLWVTLRPDGRLAIAGSAGVELANGGAFRADVRMDDPFYQFTISADRLRLGSLGTLAALLPSNPGVCLPAVVSDASLTQATACLDAFARALVSGSGSVASATPAGFGGGGEPDNPPEPLDPAASVLDAWSFSASANTGAALSLDSIRDLVRQAGQSAAGAHDLESAAVFRLALYRIAAMRAQGKFTGSNDARADLDNALAEADAAVLLRAAERDAVASLGSLMESVRLLREAEAIRVAASRPAGTLLVTELPQLLARFAQNYARALGVTRADEFNPAGNTTLQAMDRAALAENVQNLTRLFTDSTAVGINLRTTLLDEALGQLANRWFSLTDTALNTAESAGDYPGFLLALRDVVELVADRQAGVFPNVPGLAALPGASNLQAYLGRLNTLLNAELSKPLGDRSLNNLSAEIEGLLIVLRSAPAGVTFTPAAMRRIFDQLELRLAAVTTDAALSAQGRLADLGQLLEAGTLHAEYGRRFGFTAGADWETVRLPRVVLQLARRAEQTRGWSELNRAARWLLDAATRQGATGQQTPRKANLDQTVVLLGSALNTARLLMQKAGNEQGVVDLALPGEIAVDRVAGSVRYQRLSGDFSGSFRGSLRLPRFGTELTINNASFSRGGAFDVNAFGQVRLPAESPALTAAVPAAQPVHLSWSPSEGLRLSGAAIFTLSNGMFFRGSVGLEDPIYRFRLEAGGLELNLARALIPNIPAFPAASVFNKPTGFDEDGLEKWNDYLSGLHDTLGSLGILPAAPASTPGTRPEFVAAPPTDAGSAGLRTWSALSALEHHFGARSNSLSTLSPASQLLGNLSSGNLGGIDQFASTNGLGTGAVAFAPASAVPGADPLRLVGALQIDFGGINSSAVAIGPAQALGRSAADTSAADIIFPDLIGTWNQVGPGGLTAVKFADGSAAPGVRIDVGVGPGVESLAIDFAAPPTIVTRTVTSPTTRTGIYATGLMDDSLSGGNFGTGTRASGTFGARIRGLRPGYYRVFGMLSAGRETVARHLVFSGGSGTPATSFDGRSIVTPEPGNTVQNWRLGANFSLGSAIINTQGEDLVVVDQQLPPFGGINQNLGGELAGLQIFAPPVTLPRFEADAQVIQSGSRVRLSWTAWNAERLILTGTDNTRVELPVEPPTQSIEVEPASSVTYSLVATNRNGPSVVSNLTIRVQGTAAVREGTRRALREQAQILLAAREAAEAAAECALKGGTNCDVGNEEACVRLVDFLSRLQDFLLDCNTVTNQSGGTDSLIEAVEGAINVSIDVTAGRDGLACPHLPGQFEVGDVGPFIDCVMLEFNRRAGMTNGVLDVPRVNKFFVPESARIIRQVISLSAKLTEAGSTVAFDEKLLLAHATNMLTRIEAGAGTPERARERVASELASYAEALVGLADLISLVNDAAPPYPVQTAAIVAQELLSRVRQNLARFEGGNFVLWLSNPRYWEGELIAIQQAVALNALRGNAAISNLVHTASLDVAKAMRNGADFSDEIRPHDVNALLFLQRFLPEAGFAEPYTNRIHIALNFIQGQIPSSRRFTADQLERFPRLIHELADLQLLISGATNRNVTFSLPPALQPATLGSNVLDVARLTARQMNAEDKLLPYIQAVFDVRHNLKLSQSTLIQKDGETGKGNSEFRELGEIARRFNPARVALQAAGAAPNGTDAFGAGLVLQSHAALKDVAELTVDNVARFNGAPTNSLAPDFALPADLRVDRVFGEFYFNRQTGFLRGGFGGQIAFPGANFTATINQASVANDGSFLIDAATSGPLPFGKLSLSTGLRVDFAPARGLAVAGQGQLTIPTTVSTQVVSVAVNYNEAAERFSFQVSDQNLNLRLSDDFVIFDAGGGLELSTATPAGKVTFTGSVGLFSRNKSLPAALNRTNFLLNVDNAVVSVATQPGALVVSIESGTLRLPEFFSSGQCPTNVPGTTPGPSVAVNAASPIVLTFRDGAAPAFSGELRFSKLGIQVPGLSTLSVEVCSATLQFPASGLPRLTNLTATVQLPVPNATNRVDIANGAWAIDGFPTGTISLRDNLSLFDQGGFNFTLLGSGSNACQVATGLTVSRVSSGAPLFRLDGAMEFGMPPDVIGSTNGGRLFLRSCGFISGGPEQAVELALTELAVGGTFRLGGAQGLLVENGLISLEGLNHLFKQTEQNPFTVRIGGNLNIPSGPRLGVQDARFTFAGQPLPRFTLGGFSIAQNPDYEVATGLAVNVTAASLQFLNDQAPLPALLAPTNIVIGLSANAAIPPGPNPILTGAVQGLTLRLNNGRLESQLSGFGLGVHDLEFPPLTVTGELFIGGLNSGASPARLADSGPAPQGRPPGIFFAGRVGGTLNGIGVKALIAVDLHGPIGVCLDVNAGPAGIPLGPTGFLLTGVQGGVSFKNSNGDPCEFSTFYPVGADGKPLPVEAMPAGRAVNRAGSVMSWDEYRESLVRQRLAAEVDLRLAARPQPRVAVLSGPPADEPAFPCPTGDCPPASVNILCEPHPDDDRFPQNVIMKFSSLDEKTLNQFGVTRSLVESLGATPAAVGAGVAAKVRDGVEGVIPRGDPGLLGAQLAAELNARIDQQLDQLETTLTQLIRDALGGNGSIYQKVLDTAYAGVPCPDATVKLTGTFSHASVSTGLSGTVGAVLSSSGSAGVVGSINVLGVPVGKMRSFVNATDDRGLPNPSYCGDAQFALGPIEFGQMRAKFECPGCVTGFLGAFGQLAGCMSDTAIRSVLERVAPRVASLSTQQALASLTDSEKIGFVSQLFSQPPLPGLAACWRNAAQSAIEGFAPSFALCGAAQPKIFGISLGDSPVEVQAAASRTGIVANMAFSPSFIINNLALCGATIGLACQPVFPALDSASLGFGLGFPDPVAASVDALNGKLSSPEALGNFVREGFARLLSDSTITIGYQLNPFGLKLADGEGRAVLPNLTSHPGRPGAPAFVLPENRGLPSRLELLLGALQHDLLASTLWKGNADDIHLAFDEGSPQRTALLGKGVTFAKDYFPHGGIIGAGRIAMPKLLVNGPPDSLGVLLDGSKEPLARLGAAADVIGNHLLQTTNIGTLAFYVPAPNPPFFADSEGHPLDSQRLLEQIGRFDFSVPNLTNPYPFQVAFMRGELEGRLLGVPLARAKVIAQPASGQSPAFFRVTAEVPSDSWLQSFLASANMSFEIRQAPPLPVDVFFGSVKSNIDQLVAQATPPDAAVRTVVEQVQNGIADALPKVSLELAVSNLRIPDALTNLLTTANASASFFAFSPRFQPNLVATTPVARARRDGGLAFKGNFRFADLVEISDAELSIRPKLNPAELPALSGHFVVPQFPLPGTRVHDATIDFDTEPAVNQPFFRASGGLEPLVFNNPIDNKPLLSIRPSRSGDTRINGRVEALRTGPKSIAVSLSIDPSRIEMPILGPGLAVSIHGATETDPFQYSTSGPWTAAVSVTGALSLRDLLGNELVRVGSGSSQQFTASISGVGVAFSELNITVPGNLQVTVFPAATLPGGIPRTYQLGTGPGSLRIASNGNFELTGSIGGEVNFAGLPAPALEGGASVSVTQSRLSVQGNFRGGLVAPGTSAAGTFTVDSLGRISLTGNAVIQAQSFGVFQLQGVSAPEIAVQLFHDGYGVPNGARLKIVGVATDLLALSPFTNRANADFTARVTSGNFAVPNAFRVTGGRMELRRRSGIVTFAINESPSLVVLPGAQVETTLSSPFDTLSVSTDGQFYADSGNRTLQLFGGATLQGRLEIGNNPGTGVPSLSVSPSSLGFGTIDFGSVSNRSVRFRNTGQEPLIVSLLSGSRAFVPAMTDFPVPINQFVDVPVEFRPTTNGAFSSQLQVVMSPGGAQPSIGLSGTANAVPIYGQSPSEVQFGNVAIGKSRTRSLTIRNLGVAPLVLNNATLAGPFTLSPTVNQQSIAPGASLGFTLSFAPAAIGTTNGTLTLNTSDSGRTHTTSLAGLGFTEKWILVHEGGPALRGVAMIDATNGWAVGDTDTVLRTDNGGHSWQPVSIGFGGGFRSINALGSSLAVAGANGVVGVSTDSGATWRRITDSVVAAPTNHWDAVVWSSTGRLLLAGGREAGDGAVVRQTSSGFVVALRTAEPLHSIARHQAQSFVIGGDPLPERFIAVGDGGRVVRSGDGGTNWTSTTVLPQLSLRGVALAGALLNDTDPDVLIVGDQGLFFRSTTFAGTPGRRIFTLRDFTAAIPGRAVGRDGMSVLAPFFTQTLSRDDPDGAYDFLGADSSPAGTLAVGQFGQIWIEPATPPTGPFLGISARTIDFGTQISGRTRSIELVLNNRGVTTLNVNSLTLSGSSAFSLSANQALNIPTKGSARIQVRFTPTTFGQHSGTIDLASNESTNHYRVSLEGHSQANAWPILANPGSRTLVDLQLASDTTGFAASSGSIFKSTSGGTNWASVATTPGSARRLHFFSTTLGFAMGGSSSSFDLFPPCTNDCQSFILRTADGGSTWSSRPTGVSTLIADLDMATASTGYAVARSETTRLGGVTAGNVLKTIDGGLTWTLLPRPTVLTGIFDGVSVETTSDTVVFVSSGGELFRSANGGSTWTRVLNVGDSRIEDIQFINANSGFLVGQDGLFRKTTTGGTTSTAWPGLPSFTTDDLRRVQFVNASTGWIVGGDGSSSTLFRTDNGGATWIDEINEPVTSSGAGPVTVAARSTALALVADGESVLKSAPIAMPLRGSPVLPALVDFGVASLNTPVSRTFALRNIGFTPVQVSGLEIIDDEDVSAFVLESSPGPFSIAAQASATISVRYTARTLGRQGARLVAVTDGHEGTIRTDLVGEAQVFPTPITLATEPPGLVISVDNRLLARGPTAITVVPAATAPDDVINLFEWTFGSPHTLSVAPTQVKGGFEYAFQGWEPAEAGTNLTVVATNVATTYRAIFVPLRPVPPPAGAGPQLAAVGLHAGPPTDVGHGPYVRVSGATLTLPGMGAAGLSGAAFLATDRFEFTLANAPLGDPKLVAINAGSWRVSYTNGPLRFVVKADNPSLTVLGKPVGPGSTVRLDLSQTSISSQIETLGPTPILPGIAELGPSTLSFSSVQQGPARFSSFSTVAPLRVLAKPGGGFVATNTLTFRASDGPFTNTLSTFPPVLLDTPLLALKRGNNPRIELRRDSQGTYALVVTNFNLSVLKGPDQAVFGSVVGSRLTLGVGKTIGIGSLVYNADSNASVEMDFAQPRFKAVVPAGKLTAPGLSSAITFSSGITIDSAGEFDIRRSLPTLDIQGIGVSSGGSTSANFVRFYRLDGVAGFQLRDRQSFFDNTFTLALDINTAGTTSGTFTGQLLVRDFLGCDEIGLGNITLHYQSDGPYQFSGRVKGTLCSALEADFRVQFGSGGGRICHLICIDGCADSACLSFP